MDIKDQDGDGDDKVQGVDASQYFEDVDIRKNFGSSSSDENMVDPFALLELRDNVEKLDSKVDIVSSKVASLNSKLDLVIKLLSKNKAVAPFEIDRVNQLDQLISLQLIAP